MAKGVGGSTQMWTGLTPRLMAHEFRARTAYGQVQGADLADWPVQLEELVPYYERAEREIGTSHRFGRPPMPANNNYKVLANGAREIGYEHYATGPYATNVDPFDGRPGTVQDGFNMQGDRDGSKWSTRVREIPRALATGLLDLRTGCHAVEITQSAAGRVDGVVYRDAEGRERRQRAAAVAVAGNAIETPRLLLLSRNRWARTGLGNAADLVGRYYTARDGLRAGPLRPAGEHAPTPALQRPERLVGGERSRWSGVIALSAVSRSSVAAVRPAVTVRATMSGELVDLDLRPDVSTHC